MKKIVLSVLMIAGIAVAANAQKGSILVYGNTTLGSQGKTTVDGNEVHGSSTNFSLSPGVGYQFNDKWTVGVELGMGVATKSNPSYQAGAFLRYTQQINGTFSIYEQLGVGYLYKGEANGFSPFGGLSGNDIATQGNKGIYAVVSLPSVFINVKNGFGVNLGFGNVGFTSLKSDGQSSTSKFSFNFGNGVSIGISKNFGGNHK
ncbi:hypothetical protein ACI6Q2_11100 [Chitinophagaceae bacterium LWZ2-11]